VSTTDKGLLTPVNCTVIFIDFQPEMDPEAASTNPAAYLKSALLLARAAAVFQLPVILTVAGASRPAAWLEPLFPESAVVCRSGMNAWDCADIQTAVRQAGRKNLLMAAPRSEVALVMPALQALTDGFGVYVVEDASAGTSPVAHAAGVRRMEQAGAVSVTALQVLLELQRDWFAGPHRNEVMALLAEQGGSPPTSPVC